MCHQNGYMIDDHKLIKSTNKCGESHGFTRMPIYTHLRFHLSKNNDLDNAKKSWTLCFVNAM